MSHVSRYQSHLVSPALVEPFILAWSRGFYLPCWLLGNMSTFCSHTRNKFPRSIRLHPRPEKKPMMVLCLASVPIVFPSAASTSMEHAQTDLKALPALPGTASQ